MVSVKPIYIVGAGGMGRETLNIYRDAGRERDVAGFLVEDVYWEAGRVVNGKPVHRWSEIPAWPRDARFVAAIGTAERGRLVEAVARLGFGFDTAIHPSVQTSPWVSIAAGCIVCGGSILTTQVTVGEHTIINVACTVSHDCTLGRLVTLSPGVTVAGRVTIEDGAFVGAGAVIIDGRRVGAGSVVGAGAVVTEDVPPRVVAAGVPARVVKTLP